MKGDRKCITLTDDFNELILNKKVLHLVSHSVNKNGCIKEKETEKFNKMLRYVLVEYLGLDRFRQKPTIWPTSMC